MQASRACEPGTPVGARPLRGAVLHAWPADPLSRSRLPLRRKPIVREELPVFKNPTYACDYGYSSACARA